LPPFLKLRLFLENSVLQAMKDTRVLQFARGIPVDAESSPFNEQTIIGFSGIYILHILQAELDSQLYGSKVSFIFYLVS
jgi:hypothetical protein